jgi:SsrA-binding protein
MGEGIKTVATNKKAYHEFFISDTVEAGIVLAGTEVKSIRAGNLNFRDCYASIKGGEVFLVGMHVSPYEQGNIFNKDPMRERKLLLHKSEIRKLLARIQQEGLTLVPTKIYFKGNKLKIEIGVAKGKKLYDKRQTAAERDAKRNIDRSLKNN